MESFFNPVTYFILGICLPVVYMQEYSLILFRILKYNFRCSLKKYKRKAIVYTIVNAMFLLFAGFDKQHLMITGTLFVIAIIVIFVSLNEMKKRQFE